MVTTCLWLVQKSSITSSLKSYHVHTCGTWSVLIRAQLSWQDCGAPPGKKKTSCMITVEIQHVVKVHGRWEDWPTGIVLQRQSVWNVCGQWWRGHDASPRSIQEPTPVFVPCCTWRWPSHMPSRSHYSDCPLWQKLKVPANREMSKHREPTDSFVFLSDLLQCQRTTVITATKELERGL